MLTKKAELPPKENEVSKSIVTGILAYGSGRLLDGFPVYPLVSFTNLNGMSVKIVICGKCSFAGIEPNRLFVLKKIFQTLEYYGPEIYEILSLKIKLN